MADLTTIKGSGRWLDVTCSDTVDLPETPRGIIVTTSGAVKMSDGRANPCTIYLLQGIVYALHPRRIWSTGTTTTNGIVALY